MEIQEFIRSFNNIEEANAKLTEDLHIKVKEVELRPSMWRRDTVYIYNYDMIESPRDNRICQEARALILDAKANVVSISLPRFFNLGEGPAAKLDWESAMGEEKLDGTLIIVYNHWGRWFIQTRQTARAEGDVHIGVKGIPCDKTFFDLAHETLCRKFDFPFLPFHRYFCYVFELVSPYNRQVTPYDETDLALLTIVDKIRIAEMERYAVDDFATMHKFRRPKVFKITDKSSILKEMGKLGALEEGFVIVDEHFNRIKIKNKDYLAVYRAINAGNEKTGKNWADIILTGDYAEIRSYFPEYVDALDIYQDVLMTLIVEAEHLWKENKNTEGRKAFALKVKDHPLARILFELRDGKINNVRDGIHNINPKILIKEVEKNAKGQNREISSEELPR